MRRWRRAAGWPHVALVASCLAASACNDPSPPYAVGEEDIDILAEAFLIEAVAQDFSGATRDSLTAVHYGQLYDRFGIDEAQLDALRRDLSGDPRKWQAATDSVEARLKRGRDDLDALARPR